MLIISYEIIIYASIFWWLVYKWNTKNDIDLLIFTENKIPNEKIKLLKDRYKFLHEKFWLLPDLQFPWEYITKRDFIQSIKWKWFELDKNQNLILNSIKWNEWNEFNTYRHNLSSFFISDFVCWNEIIFDRLKFHCINTLTKIILLNSNLNSFYKDEIINLIIWTGKEFLGFSNNCFIRQKLAIYLNYILNKWEQKWIIMCINWKYHIVNNEIFTIFKNSIKKYNL
jgi:hypothetical protein